MSEISAQAREELVRAIAGRYRQAVFEDKERILNEFVALTGYHRKHAIRVLNRPPDWKDQHEARAVTGL